MTRSVGVVLSVVFSGAVATIVGQQPQKPTVEVYKSATCGCCSKWVEHLQADGFTVHTTNREDLADLKANTGSRVECSRAIWLW